MFDKISSRNIYKSCESVYSFEIEILGRITEQAVIDYMQLKEDAYYYPSAYHFLFNKNGLELYLKAFSIDFDIDKARNHLRKEKSRRENV